MSGLDRLIEAVRSGDAVPSYFDALVSPYDDDSIHVRNLAWQAFEGSADAFLNLSAHLLPKKIAIYLHNDDDPVVWHCEMYSDAREVASAHDEILARAGLLAILESRRAKEWGLP